MVRSATFLILLGTLSSLWADCLLAQEAEGDDLRAKTQNPVGSLYSVPLENNFDFGAPNGGW